MPRRRTFRTEAKWLRVPTRNGVSVADAAERIEREVGDLQSAVTASQRALTNAVRFTSSELLVNFVITPCLLSFQKLKPDIRIELIGDDRLLNLARGEADVAPRGGCAGARPEGAGILMRRMPSVAWAVYCSRGYGDEHGIPASREEIRNHATIGMEGPCRRFLVRFGSASQRRASRRAFAATVS
jgi:DNA-binding transcriptional LysR family regulator